MAKKYRQEDLLTAGTSDQKSTSRSSSTSRGGSSNFNRSWQDSDSVSESLQRAIGRSENFSTSKGYGYNFGDSSSYTDSSSFSGIEDPDVLATLKQYIATAANGGSDEYRRQSSRRDEAIQALRGNIGDYTAGKALGVAEQAMAGVLRKALERDRPMLQKAIAGAGTSASSMQGLLANDISTRAAESAGMIGAELAGRYAAVTGGMQDTMERFTRIDDSAERNLIDAIRAAAVSRSRSTSRSNSTQRAENWNDSNSYGYNNNDSFGRSTSRSRSTGGSYGEGSSFQNSDSFSNSDSTGTSRQFFSPEQSGLVDKPISFNVGSGGGGGGGRLQPSGEPRYHPNIPTYTRPPIDTSRPRMPTRTDDDDNGPGYIRITPRGVDRGPDVGGIPTSDDYPVYGGGNDDGDAFSIWYGGNYDNGYPSSNDGEADSGGYYSGDDGSGSDGGSYYYYDEE
jgi:hypothetical protein